MDRAKAEDAIAAKGSPFNPAPVNHGRLYKQV
jgi:hypothetical protein